MQARYYDPVIGRFYSNDPIGFRDVHSFNRYAYANNNPYKYIDPDGRAVKFSSEEAKNNFNTSDKYLSGKSSIAKASFQNVRSKNTPLVEISLGKDTAYTPADGFENAKIQFDPEGGILLDPNGGQSPATGLLHEIIHYENDNKGLKLFSSNEGVETINKENKVNEQTGEALRTSHDLENYQPKSVSGPTCRPTASGGETCG
jgi:uncharacterized protein RhaS with RHS repeats